MERCKLSLMVVITLLISTGCANLAKQTTSNKIASNALLARMDSCEKFYRAHDQHVDDENIRDAQYNPIKSHPFLSINRLLDSFKDELDSEDKINFWIAEAAKLNRQTRNIEWKNLSSAARNTIQQSHLKSSTYQKRLESCSKELLLNLTLDERKAIIKSASISDDYSTAKRIFGLYPLTSLIVKNQIQKHHKQTRIEFDKKLSSLTVNGKLQRYTPELVELFFVENIKTENTLGLPFISSTVINELVNQHAPVLEIDENGTFDQIGKIVLDNKNDPAVDQRLPTVYTMPSYTRFDGKVLLQLNYFFWFSERPPEKSFDIYAGKFDGIIWRVTLDENLQPLVFDTVHNCGCYHKFYATNNISFKLETALKEKEPPFLAQHKLKHTENKPWVIRISSVNHFVERVYQDDSFDKDAKFYSMQNYSSLRHLSNSKTSKSLFGEDGIVSASKRPERWILWPMGVPSAGAMRQWGHHATAFVGKRYFDDPFLFEKYFQPAQATKEIK